MFDLHSGSVLQFHLSQCWHLNSEALSMTINVCKYPSSREMQHVYKTVEAFLLYTLNKQPLLLFEILNP